MRVRTRSFVEVIGGHRLVSGRTQTIQQDSLRHTAQRDTHDPRHDRYRVQDRRVGGGEEEDALTPSQTVYTIKHALRMG